MTEQRPWLKLGINLWYDFGDTEIPGCRNRPWEQCVEVIAYPVRVRTAGPRGQHVGASKRGRRITGIDDLIAETDSELVHAHFFLSEQSGVFEFCSGLVDLIVCVGHYRGGGHRFALAGERFVGLVAEHIAEVGDRFAEFRRGEGTECETGNGGRRFA